MNTTLRRIRLSAMVSLALTAGLLGSACSSSGGPEAVAAPKASSAATATSAVEDAIASARVEATAQRAKVEPALVVRSDHDLVLHEVADQFSPSRTVPAANGFGSALALLVTDEEVAGWVEVLVPGRPTGSTGWLWLDGSGVELRQVTTVVHVDLAARTLTLYDGDQVVLTTPVAIGAPDAPTPTGVFSVTDKLQDPNPDGAYGPFALGLSGRSEVITDFAGGDGQIGIHGTNDPSSIGQAVSHGCIRVPNEVIVQLNELLPLGTPVIVA